MTIRLSRPVEQQLLDLALRQHRAVEVLIEDAVRLYLEAESITDVTTAEVSETQTALMGELSEVPGWERRRS